MIHNHQVVGSNPTLAIPMKTEVTLSCPKGDIPTPGGRFLLTAHTLPVDPSTLAVAHTFFVVRPHMGGIKVGFLFTFTTEPHSVSWHRATIKRVEGSKYWHLHSLGDLTPRVLSDHRATPRTERVVLDFEHEYVFPLFRDFFGPPWTTGAWLAELLRPTRHLPAYFMRHCPDPSPLSILGVPNLAPPPSTP